MCINILMKQRGDSLQLPVKCPQLPVNLIVWIVTLIKLIQWT